MNWRVAVNGWFAVIHAVNVGTHMHESLWSEYGVSMLVGVFFAVFAAITWEHKP